MSIRNKILQVEGENKIISKFDTYSASVKEAMYSDFINYTKADFNLLNKYEGIALERWKYLYDKGIVTDRSILDVITSVRKTSDLVRYFEHPSLETRSRRYISAMIAQICNLCPIAKIYLRNDSADLQSVPTKIDKFSL